MLGLSPLPTLFPYTTLFRSWVSLMSVGIHASPAASRSLPVTTAMTPGAFKASEASMLVIRACEGAAHDVRSEEHTSELQSHSDLVCRLLLEKKKHLGPTTF